MIRRIVSVLALGLVAGAAALALGADDDDGGGSKTYELLFDNAFGLTEGGDFKVAGVRAGETSTFKVRLVDGRPLAEVYAKDATRPYTRDAVLSGLWGGELEFLGSLLADESWAKDAPGRG